MKTPEKNVVGLTPFYSNPESSSHGRKLESLKSIIQILRGVANKIYVIDDGAGLPEDIADKVIKLPQNNGKSEAIRQGFRIILADSAGKPQYIVQTDADKEDNARNARALIDYFIENNITPDMPAMVIGDRYPNSAKEIKSLPAHRTGRLALMSSINKFLGYPDLRDINSGLRAYTPEFARQFLELSTASGFGIEWEQLAVAKLINAHVGSVATTNISERINSSSTLISKWLDYTSGVLIHSQELAEAGFSPLVDVFSNLRTKIEAGMDEFNLDLSPIGNPVDLHFIKKGDRYAIDGVQDQSSPRESDRRRQCVPTE